MVKFDTDYREKGLEILGFPCNQFENQEPGTPKEIREFVDKYGVKFPMFAKIKVNGPDAHPLYKYLKEKQKGDLGTLEIKWNFAKFIIDRDGNVVKRLSPTTTLTSNKELIEELLNKPATKDSSM